MSTSASTQVQCRDVSQDVQAVKFCKCVGDETDLLTYAAAWPSKGGEWACVHVQASMAHAASTADYRWDQGYGCANILQMSLTQLKDANVKVMLLQSPVVSDGAVSGDMKAQLVKSALGFNAEEPLAAQLASNRMAVIVEEVNEESGGQDLVDDDEEADEGGQQAKPAAFLRAAELIVPHALIGSCFSVDGTKVRETIKRPKFMGPATRPPTVPQ